MSPTRQRKTRAGRIFLALAVAAVAAVAAFMVVPRMNDESASRASTGTATAPTPVGGAEASAAGEAAATSSAPYTVKAEPERVATDAPVKRAKGHVDVLLTYAGSDQGTGTVQAGGFVAGVLEDGGTCTLTLTRGGQEVSATSAATADATTTVCGLLETPPGIAAGTWHAVLAYESSDAAGTSRSTEVTVR